MWLTTSGLSHTVTASQIHTCIWTICIFFLVHYYFCVVRWLKQAPSDVSVVSLPSTSESTPGPTLTALGSPPPWAAGEKTRTFFYFYFYFFLVWIISTAIV